MAPVLPLPFGWFEVPFLWPLQHCYFSWSCKNQLCHIRRCLYPALGLADTKVFPIQLGSMLRRAASACSAVTQDPASHVSHPEPSAPSQSQILALSQPPLNAASPIVLEVRVIPRNKTSRRSCNTPPTHTYTHIHSLTDENKLSHTITEAKKFQCQASKQVLWFYSSSKSWGSREWIVHVVQVV